MIIKKAQYKKVRKTVSVMIADEQYGCDCCRKKIIPYDSDRLQVTVFHKNEAKGTTTEDYHFCSWKCVFRFIPTIKTDYFFNLPYVSNDNTVKGKTMQDFMDVIADIPWLAKKKGKTKTT